MNLKELRSQINNEAYDQYADLEVVNGEGKPIDYVDAITFEEEKEVKFMIDATEGASDELDEAIMEAPDLLIPPSVETINVSPEAEREWKKNNAQFQ